jgi:hypothetical protein
LTDDNTTVKLDAEGKQLRLQAEKAKYVEAIAKSQPSLSPLLPTVSDAPKGEVTVGDKAGALGTWRAHQIVDEVAKMIAAAAKAALPSSPRVLVVDDRSLLEGDWTARQVESTLARLDRRLWGLRNELSSYSRMTAAEISRYEQEEAGQPAREDDGTRGGAGGWRKDVASSDQAAVPGAAGEGAPGAVTGALGGAVDLLALLRTDYTVTAGSVSPGPTELVTLTAAHLAADGVTIEADLFSTMPASPSARMFTDVVNARDDLAEALSKLQQVLAPVEAELAAINARIDPIEKAWVTVVGGASSASAASSSAASGSASASASAGDVLRAVGDRLARQAQRREKVAGPARAFITYAVQGLAEVDASIASLLQAPQGGQAPLFTAARRDRLGNRGPEGITHVLYVNLDALATDMVTRRSILCASGLVRFLSAGNASWLLLDTATGAITAGGQQQLADVIMLLLSTGEAKYHAVPGGLTPVPAGQTIRDPLVWLEWPARVFVVALAIVLTVVGIASIVAVVRLAFG